MQRVFERVLWDVVLLISVFVLPWWAVLAVGVVLFFSFPMFWELLVAGVLFDILYGAYVFRDFTIMFPIALGSLCLSLVGWYIKTRLRPHYV